MKAEVITISGKLGDKEYFALLIDGAFIIQMPERDYFQLGGSLDEDDPRRMEITREYFEQMAADLNECAKLRQEKRLAHVRDVVEKTGIMPL